MKEVIGRFNIAGVQYNDYQLCSGLKVNSQLKFIWEKNNEFDSSAIRIEYKGIKIGYVPSGITYKLHEYREAGIKLFPSISSVNKNNPTWNMFCVKVLAKKELESNTEIDF